MREKNKKERVMMNRKRERKGGSKSYGERERCKREEERLNDKGVS